MLEYQKSAAAAVAFANSVCSSEKTEFRAKLSQAFNAKIAKLQPWQKPLIGQYRAALASAITSTCAQLDTSFAYYKFIAAEAELSGKPIPAIDAVVLKAPFGVATKTAASVALALVD